MTSSSVSAMNPGECISTRLCGGAELFGRTLVKLDVGPEARAGPPMIASMSGRPIPRDADDRLRRAADPDPGPETGRLGLREDIGVIQRGAGSALPGDPFLVEKFREELEFLIDELVVVLQVVAEQRERLGKGAACQDHLGPGPATARLLSRTAGTPGPGHPSAARSHRRRGEYATS